MSRLYCGTSGWNYKHWREVFYRRGLAQNRWLAHYSSQFDTVELNNSFYRLPEKVTFERWRDQTPDGFTFAVKASRYLTHIKRLKDPEEPLERLLGRTEGLGPKCGIILFQFPPHWSVNLPLLEAFLKLLPHDLRSAFEFRDDSWQTDAVWSLLERYSVAYCIMSSPGLPLHLKTTTSYSYIRMHSGGEDTGSNYTDDHLAQWARRIEEMLRIGDVYIYFNNDAHGYAVRNALALRHMILGQ